MPRWTEADKARIKNIYLTVVRPVHQGLMAAYGVPDSPAADALSLAAMWQESKGATRDQGSDSVLGPATGFWQFEKNGGVAEILEARQTKDIAAELCARVGVSPQRDPVWRLFATAAGDQLAAAWTRLLIWKDPRPLPALSLAAQQEAYDYYDDNWRPGAKRPTDWPDSWAMGVTLASEVRGLADESGPPPVEQPAPVAPTGDVWAVIQALQQDVAALRRALQGWAR